MVTTEINKDGSSQNGRAESAAASGVLNQPFCMPPLTIRVLVGEGCRKKDMDLEKKNYEPQTCSHRPDKVPHHL